MCRDSSRGDYYTPSFENCRPIIIISAPAKICKQILCKHYMLYYRISTCFFPNRSTSTNLINFVQYVSDALDQRRQIDAVYTDFSKAFDKIDHDILLLKLSKFGFPNASEI